MRELRHKEGKTLVKATQGTVAKKKEGDSSAGPSSFFFFLLYFAGSGTHRDSFRFQMEPQMLSLIPALSKYFFLQQIELTRRLNSPSNVNSPVCYIGPLY